MNALTCLWKKKFLCYVSIFSRNDSFFAFIRRFFFLFDWFNAYIEKMKDMFLLRMPTAFQIFFFECLIASFWKYTKIAENLIFSIITGDRLRCEKYFNWRHISELYTYTKTRHVNHNKIRNARKKSTKTLDTSRYGMNRNVRETDFLDACNVFN